MNSKQCARRARGKMIGSLVLGLAAALAVSPAASAPASSARVAGIGSSPVSRSAGQPYLALNAGRVVMNEDGAVSVSGTHVLRRRVVELDNGTGDPKFIHEYTVQHGRRDQVLLGEAPTTERHPIKQSGVYSLVGGTIFEPARNNSATKVFGTGSKNTDLFGRDVIWSSGGKVMRRYLAEHLTETLTETVVRRGAAGPVAIWGRRWAYLDTSGWIHVRGGSRINRLVKAGPWASDLRLNYGTLSWTARNGSIHMINLADKTSRPFRFAETGPYSVDADKVAVLAPRGKARVRDLPFDVGEQPPVVIWEQVDQTATVGGDWRPRFEISKPLTSVEMSLWNGRARTRRVLHASGRRGTISGLRWDGKAARGGVFGLGCTVWVLSIKAPREPIMMVRRAEGIYVVDPADPQGGACVGD